MRRLRLSTLLISLNVGLLLLAVIGVAFIAVRFLRQLADDQALAQVTQGGRSARNAIMRSGQQLLATTQLLAERPTLTRLVQSNDPAALAAYLTQFQRTSQLDGCSVLRAGRVLAQSGIDLDWPAVWAAHAQAQNYFFHTPAGEQSLILGAGAAIPSLPDAEVLVMIQLDDSFSQEISEEVGLPISILSPQIGQTGQTGQAGQTPGPLAALRARALASGETLAFRLTDSDRYLAISSLQTASGEAAGLVETELSAAEMTRSLSQLIQTLLLLAGVVALAAALFSLILGRRLSLPLHSLTHAAERIGRGDLTNAIPLAPGFEIGTLSAALEDMRRRLLQLTANLRRQQAESNTIITGIVEGVFTVDRERRIQYLNPQAAAMLGIAVSAAIGRFCGEVLNPQDENGVRPCEEQCPIIHARFRAGARATEHLRLDPGRRRTVIISSAPPLEIQPAAGGEAGGDTPGLRQIQVMRDETEEEATRRLRDAVLANISHEFKTPLSAQLASIEMLLDQLPDLTTGQIAELVTALQRGTLRLTQLIDNLLESVRIEAGRFTLRRRPVALDEVIEQALETMRPLIDQRRQEVVVELPYPLPIIPGDAPRLTQVFVNLLANANKFSPPNSTLRISGVVNTDTVTLSIQDQGPGLPASEASEASEASAESIFVPFVRAAGEEPEAKGVGLGLWIVKSVIERHGGRVEAQGDSGGTRISVTLPRGD